MVKYQSKKISVIIPTLGLHVEKTLSLVNLLTSMDDCIEEVIIVNQSENVVCELNLLKNFHVPVFEYNVRWTGTSRSRNFGATTAKGFYVSFMDDDISIDYSSVVLAHDFLNYNRHYSGLSGCADSPVTGVASNVGKTKKSSYEVTLFELEGATLESSMIFKRDVFLRYLFSNLLGGGAIYPALEGRDLFLRMLNSGERLYYLYNYKILHDDLFLTGYASCRRYFNHGLGIGGYFLLHKDNKFFLAELIKNFGALLILIHKPSRSRLYLSKLMGIFGALSFGLPKN